VSEQTLLAFFQVIKKYHLKFLIDCRALGAKQKNMFGLSELLRKLVVQKYKKKAFYAHRGAKTPATLKRNSSRL